MSETAKTGAEVLAQAEDTELLKQLTSAPPAPDESKESAAAENGEGDAGSIPEPQEIPQTSEAPQPQTPEPYPAEWMKTQPPQERVEGVPYDRDGRRPSENTIDFELLRQQLDPETFDAVERRFKGLYRQIKATDRMLNQLGDDNLLLREAETEREATQHRETVKTEITTALESMDYEKVATLLTEQPSQPQTEDTQADPQTLEAIHVWESETDAP